MGRQRDHEASFRTRQYAPPEVPSSETGVKRGDRVIGDGKELIEKLGGRDPCPCGSGRRFPHLLPALRPLRRHPRPLLRPRLNDPAPASRSPRRRPEPPCFAPGEGRRAGDRRPQLRRATDTGHHRRMFSTKKGGHALVR